MDFRLRQELDRFFSIYQERTSRLIASLPTAQQADLADELDLLHQSVLNLLSERLEG